MTSPIENIKIVADSLNEEQMSNKEYPKSLQCKIYINGQLAENIRTIHVELDELDKRPSLVTIEVSVKNLEIELKEENVSVVT